MLTKELFRSRRLHLVGVLLVSSIFITWPSQNSSTTTSVTLGQQNTIRLGFPLSNFDPYTVSINSALDHSTATQQMMVGYTGERGREIDGDVHRESNLKGYGKRSESRVNGAAFLLNGRYTGGGDPNALWYEMISGYQHPGYDFRVNDQSYITASADGTLWIMKEDSINGKQGKKSAWLGYHTFKVVHANATETWVLHAARFVSPATDGRGTRDLDGEVRKAMGGDSFYNGTTEISGNVRVGEVRAGERITKPGNWGTKSRHLHFEVRQDGKLIDPYGWEGDGSDPLPNNPGEILWNGYTKPIVTSALLDQVSGLITVVGINFESGSTLDVWRRFENTTTSSNKNDGTRVKNLLLKEPGSRTRIVAQIGQDQDIIRNFESYVVKVVTPSGPRSRAVRLTRGQSSSVIVVSSSLQISQGNSHAPGGTFGMGRKMLGTFIVANRGNSPVFMKQLLIAGRLGADVCPKDKCPDFLPLLRNVTLAPNSTIKFSGTLDPPQPGTYNFDVVYEKQDGNWEWPVPAENGNKNHYSIIVQPGPTLSSATPPILNASSAKQRVVLSGTGLSKTIFCRLTLPNGKTTNLYLPLKQVVGGSPDRIEINTVFATRGRYYIRAHTLLEHSNELVIEVR